MVSFAHPPLIIIFVLLIRYFPCNSSDDILNVFYLITFNNCKSSWEKPSHENIKLVPRQAVLLGKLDGGTMPQIPSVSN